MTEKDFNKLKHLSYAEYCTNRQKKNGHPAVSYGKNGYVKVGYECHHIAEDQESNLSSEAKIKEYPYLQEPDQLVYLTLEEHFWAHLLISLEVLLKDSTSERCEDLSKGGIGAVLNFNINRVNKKVIGLMIAEYCNRISGQAILEADNSTEALKKFISMYGLKNQDIINIAEAHLKSTICLAHNRQAYIETEAVLLNNQSAIACICTCGGKTPFGKEYMRQHRVPGKRFLVVTPGDQIFSQWDLDDDAEIRPLYNVLNIQTLCKPDRYTTYDWDNCCGVIIDEVHHINEKAVEWIKPIKYTLSNGIKVLGLTATVKDSQSKDDDELFGGRIIEGLDIVEGIKSGILWPYNYISSLYSANGFSSEEYNLISKPLDLFLKEHNVSRTIIEVENELKRQGQKKGIIFVAGTRNIPEDERDNKLATFNAAIDLVKSAYPNAKFYILSSNQDSRLNEQNKKEFINNKTDDVFLVSFGMVNEGAHYEGVNTLIMFRTTQSEIVFTQQLGRIMRLKSKYPADPQLTVFDFTNNALTLINNATKDEDSKFEFDGTERPVGKRPQDYLEGQDVIIRCEAKDIIEYLLALRITKDQKRENRLFTTVLDELKISDIIDDAFNFKSYDLWKDIEIEIKSTTQIKRGEKQTITITGETKDGALLADVKTERSDRTDKTAKKDKIRLSKEELLIYLTKLVFDRCAVCSVLEYNKGIKIIDETVAKDLCNLTNLNYDLFAKIITAERVSKFFELRLLNISAQF